MLSRIWSREWFSTTKTNTLVISATVESAGDGACDGGGGPPPQPANAVSMAPTARPLSIRVMCLLALSQSGPYGDSRDEQTIRAEWFLTPRVGKPMRQASGVTPRPGRPVGAVLLSHGQVDHDGELQALIRQDRVDTRHICPGEEANRLSGMGRSRHILRREPFRLRQRSPLAVLDAARRAQCLRDPRAVDDLGQVVPWSGSSRSSEQIPTSTLTPPLKKAPRAVP